jgi:hypothetical protein
VYSVPILWDEKQVFKRLLLGTLDPFYSHSNLFLLHLAYTVSSIIHPTIRTGIANALIGLSLAPSLSHFFVFKTKLKVKVKARLT